MIDSPVARFLVVSASFVIVVAGMKVAAPILVPFLLSLFIAVICTPPLIWLQKKRIPTALALLIIVVLVVVISTGVGLVLSASIADFSKDLPEYQSRLAVISNGLFERLNELGLAVDLSLIKESFNPSVALSLVGSTLAQFGNLMTNAFLILLTVVFILVEEVELKQKLMHTSQSNRTLHAIEKFTHGVHQYMAIKTVVSIFTGVFIFVWLWIIGVDYFVLWGIIAFLLNFVPNLGSILAAIPAVLLALIQLGVGPAIMAGAGYMFVNVVMGNVVEPRVMGKGLNLSSLVVFLSLIFWGWVLGPVGMLLSIPLTMTVKIALESFDDTRWIGALLGGASPPVSDASYDLKKLTGEN